MIFPSFDLDILTCLPYYIYARVMRAYIFLKRLFSTSPCVRKRLSFGLLFSAYSGFGCSALPKSSDFQSHFFSYRRSVCAKTRSCFARFSARGESRFRRSVCSKARSCFARFPVLGGELFPPFRVCEKACSDLRNFARKIVEKLQK